MWSNGGASSPQVYKTQVCDSVLQKAGRMLNTKAVRMSTVKTLWCNNGFQLIVQEAWVAGGQSIRQNMVALKASLGSDHRRLCQAQALLKAILSEHYTDNWARGQYFILQIKEGTQRT